MYFRHSFFFSRNLTYFYNMFFLTIIFLFYLQPLILAIEKQNFSVKFPKKLWIYWNSDPLTAPTFTRLCMNNMRHYTNISGWQFTILDQNTVFKYMSPQYVQKINFIKNKTNDRTPQTLADLYRLVILYENGGMWLDANSFLVRDFGWVQNLHKDSTVYNKVADEPDILMFTYDWLFGGNKTIVYDQQRQIDVRLFPGTETWAFLAKPKSKFLEDVIERIIYMFKKPSLQDYYKQNEQLGYKYRQEIDPYFYCSIYQIQTLLQSKQKEIDINPQKFNVKYAVQYYKMWNIDALQTAYLLYQVNQWEVESTMRTLFTKPISQFTDKLGKSINFIKFSASYYPFVSSYLNNSVKAICLNAIEPFPSNSLISQFLFKYSPKEQLVQRHLELQAQRDKQQPIECTDFISNIKSQLLKIGVIVVLGLLLVNLLLFGCIKTIKFCRDSLGGPQKAEFKKLRQSEPLQFTNK